MIATTSLGEVALYAQVASSLVVVLGLIGSHHYNAGRQQQASDVIQSRLDDIDRKLDEFGKLEQEIHSIRLDQERHNGRLIVLEQAGMETMRIRAEWAEWRSRFGNDFHNMGATLRGIQVLIEERLRR